MKITIRSVKKNDIEELFSMLQELEEHENGAAALGITREDLEREFFGVGADWQGLVAAADNDQPIGLLFYSFANLIRSLNQGPMIQIDNLYIKPSFRKKGIGEKLLHELARVAQQKNIRRIYVWCVKDNIQGQRFYEKMGAENLDFFFVYKMFSDQLLLRGGESACS